MMGSLYAKLIALGLMMAGLYLWGHHKGAESVQARWDAAQAMQSAAAANQRAASAQQTLDWTQQFQGIQAHYEAATHEPTPTVADATAVAVSAGTLRLPAGSSQTDRCGGSVSGAASRSRAADAAATQALADRVTAAIAAVRAGDDADARERALGQQVTALQALLRAERQQSPAQ